MIPLAIRLYDSSVHTFTLNKRLSAYKKPELIP